MLRHLKKWLGLAVFLCVIAAGLVFPGGPVDKFRAFAVAAHAEGADHVPHLLERLSHVHHLGQRRYYINSWRKRQSEYQHYEVWVIFDGWSWTPRLKDEHQLDISREEPVVGKPSDVY